MIKGLIGSLISAAVFFAAGAISVEVIGLNEDYSAANETVNVEWDSEEIDERVSGSKTWNFESVKSISEVKIDSSNLETHIEPSADGKMSVSVSTKKYRAVSVDISWDDDENGCVDISLSGGWFKFIHFGGCDGVVTISLPDNIYKALSIELGAGSLDAKGIKALDNSLDIGSGKFTFSVPEDFTAKELVVDMGSGNAAITGAAADRYELDIGSGKFALSVPEDFTAKELTADIGSGSVTITGAAAERYEVDMGSGRFDISGLTGSGDIEIGSGRGTARFAEMNGSENNFIMGSGKLDVYIPSDTKADLYADIGSGSVSLDCCGTEQKLTSGSEGHVALNGGSDDHENRGEIKVDMGSGKVSFMDADTDA